MHPDARSIRERLVDDRPLALAQVPGYVLEGLPAPKPVRYGVASPGRFTYLPRRAIGIMDVLEIAQQDPYGGGFQGSSRPSIGML